MPDVQQSLELERVSARIRELIVQFCRSRIATAPEFHMVELLHFIGRHHAVAPDSPGRILRELRKRGAISYSVVSRNESLYRIEAA